MGNFLRARSGRRSPATATTCSVVALSMLTAVMMPSTATLAQAPAETVIHNGIIVNATGKMQGDIRIQGEKIVEIAPKLKASPGAKEIDATGKFLMPGIIDTHTHLPVDVSIVPPAKGNQDNIITGGRAALAGGVTLLGDFIGIKNDEDPNAYADRNIAFIHKNSIADVYIHASVQPLDTAKDAPRDPLTQKKTFDALAARGIVSTGEDFMAREAYDKNSLSWMRLFRVSGEAGVVSMVHAEDYSILADAQEQLALKDNGAGLSIKNFSASAPVIGEVLAVQRTVAIAEATGSPMYVLHMTSGRALKVIEDAKRRGLTVFAESRPWNLFGTELGYTKPDGGIYVGGPPLRPKWDQDMIWEAIRKGVVDTIGTDHTAFSKEAKLDPTQTILDKRMGQNTLQDYPAMMFSEGVMKERITPEQMVAVTSTNAAKIFGMFPRKGVIAVGSDADIVIWDPTKKKILNDKDQLSKAGYSTYAGKEVTGVPIMVIRRGEIVVENGKVIGQPGSGKYIPGNKFPRPTNAILSND